MKFKVGDKVILGEHTWLPDEPKTDVQRNWTNLMRPYVGKVAIIINVWERTAEDGEECGVRINSISNQYMWRMRDMRSPIEHKDQRCIGCNLPSPHEEPNLPDKTYICAFCKVFEEI